MTPDQAEELLAGETSGRIDSAELQKSRLILRQKSLQEKLRQRLQRLEANQIELAAADDYDMPLKKGVESDDRKNVQILLAELGTIWNGGKGMDETAEALSAIEKRLESLESILPGNEEYN